MDNAITQSFAVAMCNSDKKDGSAGGTMGCSMLNCVVLASQLWTSCTKCVHVSIVLICGEEHSTHK